MLPVNTLCLNNFHVKKVTMAKYHEIWQIVRNVRFGNSLQSSWK
jgi:hypothetical protein